MTANARLLVSLLVAVALPAQQLPPYQAESSIVTRNELRLAQLWAEAIVSNDANKPGWLEGWISTALPFAFRYGGQDSASLLGSWQINRGPRGPSWRDPATGLLVSLELKHFSDYPAIEWMVTFENTGSKDTPVIEDMQALNLRLNQSRKGQNYVVHGAAGGRSLPDDMQPFSIELPAGHPYRRQIQLGGDFPSSNRHLPFFNLETPENRGVLVGIGWSGNWQARIRAEGTELQARAGLTNSHFILHAGEQVRSSRILVLFWQGKRLHGHNMFRQLLYKHYLPALEGRPQQPLVSVNVCFTYNGYGGFLHDATERTVSAIVKPFADLGAELFIIDAGWYEGAPWNQWLGNWQYSRTKYPRGFRPISEPLAKAGMIFGLWFASEDLSRNAPLFREHPEWIRSSGKSGGWLRMELPDAREWFLKSVDQMVRNEGMRCYRQDGSARFGDEPSDRISITERKHISGLYQLWDTIRKRYPDMVMEGCSGGGRRIDLETVSRFHWHQKSDRWYDSESDQLSLYGANLYLPGGVINIPTQRTDNYGAWSSFAGQFCLGWNPLDPHFPTEEGKRQVARYKRIRPLLSGDFYPLTAASLDDAWIAYQFHRPDLERGLALVFRRRGSEQTLYPAPDTLKVRLRGLNPQNKYRLHFEAEDRSQTLEGRKLSSGIDVSFRQAPSAEMITYEAVR